MKEKKSNKKVVNISERLEKKLEESNITINKKNKVIVIVSLIIITAVMTIVIINYMANGKEKYMITKGTIEKSNSVNGYVIKDETIINTDTSKTVVPVVAEGKKVNKDGVVATYNSKAITDKSQKLEKLDKDILTAMTSIPPIFSSDIKSIEESIQQVTKEAVGQTSYTKIQECKKKISDLINKKAVIIGELSPSGAYIKELINQRNTLENEISSSKDNIVSDFSGIVSYKLDGLEDKIKFNNIESLTIESLKKYVASTKNKNTYGIKVVNNFKAYIMFEVEKEEIDSNSKVGQKKNIRLLDEDIDDIPVYVSKIEQVGEKYEITIELDQGIEYFINRREAAFDFIWWSYGGLKVPNQAINKKNEVRYVSVYRNEEIIEIPVKILKESEKFSIVDNYSKEELKEKNISTVYSINLYDEVIL